MLSNPLKTFFAISEPQIPTVFHHCVKKVILRIIFCMLKKKSQNFFFIFYHLQQTPTWVVHKNSNHQPGFHIKHENAATTSFEIFHSNHLPFLGFLAQKCVFSKHKNTTCFNLQQTPTWLVQKNSKHPLEKKV